MRSSKSRSRGNKNRNNRPSGGNIINRVFDSNGPDGKVRGTPQQIIEKYNQLHRDAQLSGDRVNAENFAQHAEHYLRMLGEAQREVEKARVEQEEKNRERQAERDRERQERLKAQETAASDPATMDQPDVAIVSDPVGGDDGTGLVETPEAKPVEKPRKPRARRPKKEATVESAAPEAPDAPEAAE
jgi:sRNA-binding protein